MTLPANVSTGTVTGPLTNIDGTAAVGKVTFIPAPARLLDAAGDTVLICKPVIADLSGGNFSVDLPATDDADLNPTGWTYTVFVDVVGRERYWFAMALPGGSTVTLADVTPVDSELGVATVVGPTGPTGPQGPQGVPGTPGAGGGGSVDAVVAGTAITVNSTDPANPIVGVTPGSFDASGAAATVNTALTTHAALTTAAHGGIVASSDVRLTDARTPTSHAATHATAGSDPVTAAAIGAATTGALAAHEADTTAIHGIANTANLIVEGDARLTNARTPSAHAASHADGGSDEVSIDGSQLTTGTVADARIAATIARDSEVTSAISTHAALAVLDGDTAGGVLAGTYPSPSFAADMATQAELNTHEADTTAVHGITDTAALVLTADARLSDARTPTAHATSHQDGGADELALDGSQITTGTVADARIASTIARDSEVTSAVAAHEADTTAVHGITNTANLILEGDSRLTNARTPTAHAASHLAAGSDPISAPAWSLFAEYTTAGTTGSVTLPANTLEADVLTVGASSGAGAGRRGAAGSVRCGGGSGGPGGFDRATLRGSVLAETFTVVVGAKGTGGAAQTVDDSSGANGTSGTASSLSGSTSGIVCAGQGGTFGSGGTATTGLQGGGRVGIEALVAAVAASTTGLLGTAGTSSNTMPSAGGSGAGLTTGNAASAGGSGGRVDGLSVAAAAGGAATGAAGTNGTSSSATQRQLGLGMGAGGGGGGSGTGVGGDGGNGGNPGGSGGGGAASLNGNNSGKGGDGADGYVAIWVRRPA